MSAIARGLRDVLRKKGRTIGVALIIGLSFGVYLTTSMVSATISQRASTLAREIDATVTIRPAGTIGFFSSETINDSILPEVRAADHVVTVQELVLQREGSPGEFGAGPGRFRNILLVEGEDPSQGLIIFSGGSPTLQSGRALDANDALARVAYVGAAYAANNNIEVGDQVKINGTSLQVVGVFSVGSGLGDRSIIIPYQTAKALYGVNGPQVLYVRVDTVGDVDGVVQGLRATLGDAYDIVPLATTQGTALQSSLNAITAGGEAAAVGALGGGTAVITFAMALVTQERIHEIGLLKALGFRNSRIAFQFLVESLTLAGLGFVVALFVIEVAGPALARALAATFGGGPSFGEGALNLLTGITLSIDPTTLAASIALIVLMGIIGSLYPIIRAMRLRPAEALRHE